MLVTTQITTLLLLGASFQTASSETRVSQLRVNSPHFSHTSSSASSTTSLRLVIGFLDKLLMEMNESQHQFWDVELLATTLIDNYAAFGVPSDLDATDTQEGIRNCEEGLFILASTPDHGLEPLVAAELESTLHSIMGDLSYE